jgi:hypothetical protein
VTWRLYAADVSITGDVWLPFAARAWGLVSLQWLPSSTPQLTVNELQLTVGLARNMLTFGTLDLALAVQGGARVQIFALTDASLPTPSGALFSGVGEIRAFLRWHFAHTLALAVGLGSGFWAPSYDHFVQGSPVWARSPLFLEGAAGIMWGR